MTQEEWNLAHKVREGKKRSRKNFDEPNMYAGLVFCADCGAPLILHRAHTMDPKKNNFACATYKKKGSKACTTHYISERQLSAVILDDIKRVTHFARQKEKQFIELIARKITVETRKQIAILTKEIGQTQKRNKELDSLFKRLYEDNVLCKIPNEIFRKLSDEYLLEQKEIQTTIPKWECDLENLKSTLTNADKFVKRANEYTDLTTLIPETLRIFVDKIVVHDKSVKYSRTADQKIKIYYRDIGYLGDYTKEIDIAEPQYDFELLSNGDMVAIDFAQDPIKMVKEKTDSRNYPSKLPQHRGGHKVAL